MSVTTYMTYTIYSRDPATVEGWRSFYGYALNASPETAARLLGLTFPPASGPLGAEGMYFVAPYFIGSELRFPLGTGIILTGESSEDAGIAVPGQNDPFGTPYPDGIFYWTGYFVCLGGITDPPGSTTYAQRRWIQGFELPGANSGTTASGQGGTWTHVPWSRDAARCSDGYGIAFRRETGSFGGHTVMEYLGGGASTKSESWERFYIRLRNLPASATPFWRASGSGGTGAEGVSLRVTSSGALQACSIDSAAAVNVVGTSAAIALNEWAKIDVKFKYLVASPTSTIVAVDLYINGTLEVAGNGGVRSDGTSLFHNTSIIANSPSVGANTLELDFDDWHCADWPDMTSPDWLSGNHIQLITPTAFGAGHSGNWTGDWRALLQNPSAVSTFGLTSSTSSARLEAATDPPSGTSIDQLGCIALSVGVHVNSTGGSVGYSIAGGGDVLGSAITSTGFNSVLYRPSGLTEGATLAPLKLLYIHEASSNAETVKMLMAAAQYSGAYGTEDAENPDAPPIRPDLGVHNAPYGQSVWSAEATQHLAPVVVKGGTYTGNGTGQDITFDMPVHFWWSRRVAPSNSARIHWWTSLMGTHGGIVRDPLDPYHMVQASLVDDECKLRIAGAASLSNTSGSTYQYIAVCDPANRFILNGAFRNTSSPSTHALDDSGFTPIAAFLQQDYFTTANNIPWLHYKGPGHATDGGSVLDSAQTTTQVATFSAGSFTSGTRFNVSGNHGAAYSLWRSTDGDGVTGLVQILQYTGDGTASRVISLTPITNRYPMLALVAPMDAAPWFRDPSHTGSTSMNAGSTSTSTTAITAGGVDSITVGITLNATGIVHSVFVISGASSGWNNGTIIPVPPGTTGITPAPTPDLNPGCLDIMVVGDSSGGAGCTDAFSIGASSGGSGCIQG